MGTTLQPITAGKFNFTESSTSQPGSAANFFANRTSSWQQQQQSQPQNSIESPEAQFSTPAIREAGLFGPGPGPGPGPSPAGAFDGTAASQPQRGSSQVPNSTTPNAPGTRNALTPTPGTQNSASGGAAGAANMEKRGPVEFNHAISYVNKIKVRNNQTSQPLCFCHWVALVLEGQVTCLVPVQLTRLDGLPTLLNILLKHS